MHHGDNVDNTVAASKCIYRLGEDTVLGAESPGKADWDHV